MDQVLDRLRAILADVTEIADVDRLGPLDGLRERGLNSLESVAVLLEIERQFDCRIDDADVRPEMFTNLRTLSEALPGRS